jgi:hypothetical protein
MRRSLKRALVMAGLVPAIHVFAGSQPSKS